MTGVLIQEEEMQAQGELHALTEEAEIGDWSNEPIKQGMPRIAPTPEAKRKQVYILLYSP